MYDFDKVIDRVGTGSIKWNKQDSFGVPNGLLPFWIADSDFATLPEIVEGIKQRLEHPIIGYSDPRESCLKAIQGWWARRHEWEVPLSALLPGTGVVTSIRFTLQALTEPGDKVLVFTPVYDPFFAVIENSGRTLVDCPLIHENNTFRMDYDLLERQLKDGVKAVVLCNPHNPIGRVWTYDEMGRLADLCAQYGVYLLSDEIHGDIALGERKYVTMGRFPQIHDKLVVYTAISKTFNLAGLISSCMMIPNPELKARVDAALSAAWIFGPTELAFAAIEAAYTYGDRWVDEQNAYLTKNALYVNEFCMKNMPQVGVTKQEGTFLMWLDFRCLGMSSDELTDVMVKDYKLALGNGCHYGKQADGFMRLNIGCPRATLEQGLTLIHQLYKDRRTTK